MSFFSNFFRAKKETDFKELVKNGAIILDVRTPAEFSTGHIIASLNIELQMLNSSLSILKAKNKPFVVVCRSGSRSGIAINILKNAGIEAYNGGGWTALKSKIS